MTLIRILKNWTLPLAMVCGTIGYFLLACVPPLRPLGPPALHAVRWLTPLVIFLMLFFTFVKMKVSDLRPQRWAIWLLVLQTALSAGLAAVLIATRPGYELEVLGEGALACVIIPPAMAAPVITGKLGGNAGALTTYILAANFLSAVVITLLCPLVHPNPAVGLWSALLTILYKVFTLLIVPFVAACLLRLLWPRAHAWCAGLKDASFYLWGFSLTMIIAQAVRIVMLNLSHLRLELMLLAMSAVVCGFLFLAGKTIGGRYGERISGGQALGQKNTTFGIWMALSYLQPLSAVALGGYIVAQNVVNSWQLWRKERSDGQA